MAVSLDEARDRDLSDSVPCRAEEFLVPLADGGDFPQVAYLVGNSLGLQPRSAEVHIRRQLRTWAEIGVEGHFEDESWVSFPERLEGNLATLIGALPQEVVTMNTLTVNLHLMLASFYAPTEDRFRVVIEEGAFPSDVYAIASHIRHRGIDSADALIEVAPGGARIGNAPTFEDTLESWGDSIALVLLGAVNYQTGERLAMESITGLCRSRGITIGWDLAHAIGNVPMDLHGWGADFAVWCTYKYLNGGPGSIGGAFVHERHLASMEVPRLEGWWGNRIETRFQMRRHFDPPRRASAWALSTPPTLAIAPIEASLEIFAQSDFMDLRRKSIRLTGFLESCLDECLAEVGAHIITPRNPEYRGSQLSIRLESPIADEVVARMRLGLGVMGDARGESIVRLAPTALYNTFEDCWRGAQALGHTLSEVAAGAA